MKSLVKRSLALALLAGGALSACTPRMPALAPYRPSVGRFNQPSAQAEIPGQVVVQFRTLPSAASLQAFSARYGLQALRVSPQGLTLFRHPGSPCRGTGQASPATQNCPGQSLLESLSRDPQVEYSHGNTRLRRFFTVNDPRSAEQNGLAVIGSAKAWDLGLGDPRVTIAVLDTGVDLQHPDLQANLVPGYNAIEPSQPPQDDNEHGTHAAGIAAAVGDNRAGITGACPRCKLMPVKILGSDGLGGSYHLALGLIWAVDHGADIINLSLGADKSDLTLERAIKYALNHHVTVVAAAGNGVLTQTENGEELVGVDTPMYPAALPGVIAVGAVDTQRQRTRFSNFGSWVTVMAPGQGILSTLPGDSYGTMDGTSMAAPMVSGVIGLMLSRHPYLTPAQVKVRLEGTAIDLGNPGFDTDYAHGMVDAFRAVL